MYKQMRGWISGLILALAAASLGAAPPENVALSRIVKVHIEAQSLSTALIEFSKQAGVQVVTPAIKVNNLETRGVQGKMPLSVALTKLLQGTKLGFHTAGANTVGLNTAVPETSQETAVSSGTQVLQLAWADT